MGEMDEIIKFAYFEQFGKFCICKEFAEQNGSFIVGNSIDRTINRL